MAGDSDEEAPTPSPEGQHDLDSAAASYEAQFQGLAQQQLGGVGAEAARQSSSSSSAAPAADAAASAAAAAAADASAPAPAPDQAAEIRERFRYLSSDDQKTVCRRACQIAQDREEQLVRRIHLTIERYSRALEVSHAVAAAVASGSCTDAAEVAAGGVSPMGLTPELKQKYEARIQLLNHTLAGLREEPFVCLPRLTALEQAKGLACAGYARAALSATKLKENPAVSQAVTQTLGGVQGAFSCLASRWRRGGSFTAAPAQPPTAPAAAAPAPAQTVEDFVGLGGGQPPPAAPATATAAEPS